MVGMSCGGLFSETKSYSADILHNSWQRRAEGIQRTNQEGGVTIHSELRRPPNGILMPISSRLFFRLKKIKSPPLDMPVLDS